MGGGFILHRIDDNSLTESQSSSNDSEEERDIIEDTADFVSVDISEEERLREEAEEEREREEEEAKMDNLKIPG
jgi:hypothetical protein